MWYLAIGCRAAIAIVFLLALAGKVTGRESFGEFTASVRAMRVVPARAVGTVAAASVTAEALVVVLAVIPTTVTAIAGCGLAALLAIVFSAGIAASLRRGNRAPCRCFGRSATPLGPRHIMRNAILLIVAAAGLAATLGHQAVSAPGVVVAAGTGLFVGIVIASYDELAELLAPMH